MSFLLKIFEYKKNSRDCDFIDIIFSDPFIIMENNT